MFSLPNTVHSGATFIQGPGFGLAKPCTGFAFHKFSRPSDSLLFSLHSGQAGHRLSNAPKAFPSVSEQMLWAPRSNSLTAASLVHTTPYIDSSVSSHLAFNLFGAIPSPGELATKSGSFGWASRLSSNDLADSLVSASPVEKSHMK